MEKSHKIYETWSDGIFTTDFAHVFENHFKDMRENEQ